MLRAMAFCPDKKAMFFLEAAAGLPRVSARSSMVNSLWRIESCKGGRVMEAQGFRHLSLGLFR